MAINYTCDICKENIEDGQRCDVCLTISGDKGYELNGDYELCANCSGPIKKAMNKLDNAIQSRGGINADTK